jgi:hypothetical protein
MRKCPRKVTADLKESGPPSKGAGGPCQPRTASSRKDNVVNLMGGQARAPQRAASPDAKDGRAARDSGLPGKGGPVPSLQGTVSTRSYSARVIPQRDSWANSDASGHRLTLSRMNWL